MAMHSNKQCGVTLLEVIVVMVIGIAFFALIIRFYDQYRIEVDLQQVRANVDNLFQGMSKYYYANCRTMQNPATGDEVPDTGALDPKTNKQNQYALDLPTLYREGFIPNKVINVPALVTSYQLLFVNKTQRDINSSSGMSGGPALRLNRTQRVSESSAKSFVVGSNNAGTFVGGNSVSYCTHYAANGSCDYWGSFIYGVTPAGYTRSNVVGVVSRWRAAIVGTLPSSYSSMSKARALAVMLDATCATIPYPRGIPASYGSYVSCDYAKYQPDTQPIIYLVWERGPKNDLPNSPSSSLAKNQVASFTQQYNTKPMTSLLQRSERSVASDQVQMSGVTETTHFYSNLPQSDYLNPPPDLASNPDFQRARDYYLRYGYSSQNTSKSRQISVPDATANAETDDYQYFYCQ